MLQPTPPRDSDQSTNLGRPHDPLCLTRDRFVGPDRTDYSANQFCVCGVRNLTVER